MRSLSLSYAYAHVFDDFACHNVYGNHESNRINVIYSQSSFGNDDEIQDNQAGFFLIFNVYVYVYFGASSYLSRFFSNLRIILSPLIRTRSVCTFVLTTFAYSTNHFVFKSVFSSSSFLIQFRVLIYSRFRYVSSSAA